MGKGVRPEYPTPRRPWEERSTPIPHHAAPREVRPHALERHYAHPRADRARISASAQVAFLATELAVVLPTVPVPANPYRALRGTRAKREALLEEVYLPQALFEVLRRHGDAGRLAALALLGLPPDDPH